jgi:hypothetical protein
MAAGSQTGERMVKGAVNLSNAPRDFMSGWNNASHESKPQPANQQAARINGK